MLERGTLGDEVRIGSWRKNESLRTGEQWLLAVNLSRTAGQTKEEQPRYNEVVSRMHASGSNFYVIGSRLKR